MKFFIVLLVVTSVIARPTSTVKHVGLKQLGKYSGVNDEGTAYEKIYYVSNYLKMTPPAARSFCKSFSPNMDLVSFESRNEFIVVRTKFEPEVRDQTIFVIVGGFAHASTGKSSYYWISSGLKMFSDLEPSVDKACLGVRKEAPNDSVAFVPISCDQSLRFMCQEMDIQYAN